LQNQKLLKYSPSDNFSPELEREIDDMIAKAAYNESQKTFQQMSQKAIQGRSYHLANTLVVFDSAIVGVLFH
jgi:hypothetical protein